MARSPRKRWLVIPGEARDLQGFPAGTIAYLHEGHIVIEHNADYTGKDSLEVIAHDGMEHSAPATYRYTIYPR
jgi:hypothetical protein